MSPSSTVGPPSGGVRVRSLGLDLRPGGLALALAAALRLDLAVEPREPRFEPLAAAAREFDGLAAETDLAQRVACSRGRELGDVGPSS
jgi:hypothetical protein